MKQYPKCVHIRRSRDLPTVHLLRAGILQRHHPLAKSRDRLFFSDWIPQFCNAEIQQLGHTFRRDQNVCRFDVSMNHVVLVCVLNGSTNYEKQLEPVVSEKKGLTTILVDRYSIHILHNT